MLRLPLAACAALAVILCGCPGPECSTSDPCQNGFVCNAAGACEPLVPDAGTTGGGGGGAVCPDTSTPSAPNVLHNPGAECETRGWFVPDVKGKATLSVETTNPHTGSKALKITATAAATAPDGPHVYNDAVVNAAAGETWCAQAFMRGGTTTDGRLAIRHWVDGEGGVDESFSSPVTQSWVMVPPTRGLLKVKMTRAEKLQLRIVLQAAQAGHTLIVDDVHLWRSAGGNCSER